MKLSRIEIVILLAGIAVASLLVALLTPATDAISLGLRWVGVLVVFLAGFFLVRRLARRG